MIKKKLKMIYFTARITLYNLGIGIYYLFPSKYLEILKELLENESIIIHGL